jgi:hypothetical protein
MCIPPPKDGLTRPKLVRSMNKTRNKPDMRIWQCKSWSNIDSMPESELYQNSYVEFDVLCISLPEKNTGIL